jgi:hypothetical protein
LQFLLNKRRRDYLGGAVMFALGAAAAIQGSTYQIGTLSRMGSGFFPVTLGVILALTGLAIAIVARFTVYEGEAARRPPEWRGWLCIGASIVGFSVFGVYGGLLPATFVIVFVSALADRRNTVKSSAALALAMVGVCVVIFWWGLQLQFPLFSWN